MVYEDFFLGSGHETIRVKCRKCGKHFDETLEADYKERALEKNEFFCSPRCASK